MVDEVRPWRPVLKLSWISRLLKIPRTPRETEMIVGQTLYCYCLTSGIDLTQYQVLNTLILNGLNQKRNAQRQKLILEAFSYEHMIL